MSTLTNTFSLIANAIRQKIGGSATYTPAQMPQAILDIPAGIECLIDGVAQTEDVSFESIVDTLPVGVTNGNAVIYNNEIHVVSGTNHYKWNGLSWSYVSTPPINVKTAVIYNNEIHAFAFSSNKHYKWNGSSWNSASSVPNYSFNYGTAIVYNNDIHLIGKTYHYKWNGSSWSSVSTVPVDFSGSGGGAVVYDNAIHILGSNGTNKLTHYKWNGSSWSFVSNLPFDNSFFYPPAIAVVYNNEIHVFDGTILNYHYKWNGSSWNSVSSAPYYCYGGMGVVFDAKIHLIGSGSGNQSKNHYCWDGKNWTNKFIYKKITV